MLGFQFVNLLQYVVLWDVWSILTNQNLDNSLFHLKEWLKACLCSQHNLFPDLDSRNDVL